VKIAGFLGSPLFKQLPFTVDYGQSTLTFYNPETFKPPAGQHFDIKWQRRILNNYLPRCVGRINNQHNDLFQLDTGATYTIFRNSIVDSYPALTNARKIDHTQSDGRKFERYVLESFEILGRRQTNGRAYIFEGVNGSEQLFEKHGLVGAEILSDLRLTFDYRRNSIWVEESPEPSVDELVRKGADLNQEDFLGCTPLLFAAEGGKLERVRALLLAGARPNVRSNQKATPLSIASWKGHSEVVEALLKYGADANAKGPRENTPLIWGARAGHLQIVKLLLEHGADPNSYSDIGGTALTWAAFEGHADVVKELIKVRADVHHKNDKGKNALMLAKQEKHADVVKILEEAGAKD
jgi:hypothetical protein